MRPGTVQLITGLSRHPGNGHQQEECSPNPQERISSRLGFSPLWLPNHFLSSFCPSNQLHFFFFIRPVVLVPAARTERWFFFFKSEGVIIWQGSHLGRVLQLRSLPVALTFQLHVTRSHERCFSNFAMNVHASYSNIILKSPFQG